VLRYRTTDETGHACGAATPAVASFEVKEGENGENGVDGPRAGAVSNLPALTCLNLSECGKVTDAGLSSLPRRLRLSSECGR
jgi:hypothetical protein